MGFLDFHRFLWISHGFPRVDVWDFCLGTDPSIRVVKDLLTFTKINKVMEQS